MPSVSHVGVNTPMKMRKYVFNSETYKCNVIKTARVWYIEYIINKTKAVILKISFIKSNAKAPK